MYCVFKFPEEKDKFFKGTEFIAKTIDRDEWEIVFIKYGASKDGKKRVKIENDMKRTTANDIQQWIVDHMIPAGETFESFEQAKYRLLNGNDDSEITIPQNEFKEDKFTIDKLVRMQHYGLPTRLLDITSNPLIALYFACCSNPDENGQVIAFSTNRKKIKYFDLDTVSCIANLSLLSYEELEKLSSIDARKGSMELPELTDKLADLIQNEKSYFRNRIIPDDLKKVVFLKAKINNERIQSQAGAFLLFGLDPILPETDAEFPLNRVEIANKNKILEELAQLNISESTVYPSMEKTAAEITKKFLSVS